MPNGTAQENKPYLKEGSPIPPDVEKEEENTRYELLENKDIEIVSPCPYCDHPMNETVVWGRAAPGATLGWAAPPPGITEMEVEIHCHCDHPHEGRPDTVTNGCGLGYNVTVPRP